jgi:hypothetical protein
MTLPRAAFLVATSLALAGPVLAATAKPATAAYGTREQLRQCLDREDALQARLHAMQAAAAAHDRRFDANEAEDARLVETKARLDRSDKAAIQSFNDAVLQHQQHVREVNDEAEAAEAAAKAYGDDKAALDEQCGNVTYRPADIDAVNRERRKAPAVAAAASAP